MDPVQLAAVLAAAVVLASKDRSARKLVTSRMTPTSMKNNGSVALSRRRNVLAMFSSESLPSLYFVPSSARNRFASLQTIVYAGSKTLPTSYSTH